MLERPLQKLTWPRYHVTSGLATSCNTTEKFISTFTDANDRKHIERTEPRHKEQLTGENVSSVCRHHMRPSIQTPVTEHVRCWQYVNLVTAQDVIKLHFHYLLEIFGVQCFWTENMHTGYFCRV